MMHNVTITRPPRSHTHTTHFRWAISYAYALGYNMLVPWDIYLPTPTGVRYYGSASEYADLYTFVRGHSSLLDETDVAVPNGANLSASFTLVHTGNGGDNQRWRLPTNPVRPSNGRMVPSGNLGACEWSCWQDEKCVGIYFGGGGSENCAVLYTPLVVVTHTQLHGESYVVRNRSDISVGPNQMSPAFVCNTTGVALEPRRPSGGSGYRSPMAIHLVSWDYTHRNNNTPRNTHASSNMLHASTAAAVSSSQITHEVIRSMHSVIEGPIEVSLHNIDVFNDTKCGSFKLSLLAPGGDVVLNDTTCRDGITRVVVPTPLPWSVILASSSGSG